jgi:hypothetical protein
VEGEDNVNYFQRTFEGLSFEGQDLKLKLCDLCEEASSLEVPFESNFYFYLSTMGACTST